MDRIIHICTSLHKHGSLRIDKRQRSNEHSNGRPSNYMRN